MIRKYVALLFCSFVTIGLAQAQECKTWNDSPRKGEAEDAHSIYRPMVRNKDFKGAYEYWKTAFDIAPAADGKRDFHYTDGIAIFSAFYKETEDETKKEEYMNNIIKLYEGAIDCYDSQVIEIPNCDENCYNFKKGDLLGRMGYQMFYEFRTPYDRNYEVLSKSLEYTGDAASYAILEPLAYIAVNRFQNGEMEQQEIRELHDRILAIADENIETNEDYGEYYDITKQRVLAVFEPYEKQIFDCAYFKDKLMPDYKEHGDDFDVMKYVYSTLKQQGCDENDSFLAEVKSKYERMASEFNAAKQAEYDAKNPSRVAKKLYDSGDFKGAIAKYDEAIAKETDSVKRGNYLFSKASIQFRKLKSYGAARATFYEAAKARPGWGRPYMLIGDMYASASRSCGDSWNQRLAIIAAMDKWLKAKSVDPNFAQQASSRIAKYSSSLPAQDDAFMRGFKAGQTVKVGCWIGESVRLRF